MPIPGTRRRKYLQEYLDAVRVQLTAGDLERIHEIAPQEVAGGTRRPESAMKALGR